ncbi:MAG: DUF2845 domain-containing protein [Xanthomonadales bacterium]|nr:hypothetical protein [Xanthomonadales bacterium]MCC6594178.1 DUF2845 domain-containing protein [Xanthomonadales bacterium]MCE7931666.1 DUF2845 domain-containing protein [Xanthomonadales bacterium PRO6]
MRPHLLIPLAPLLAFAESAHALRCGNALVTEGMTRHEVRKRCGDPDDASVRYETVYRRNHRHESVAIEIEIEEWFYDFDSNRLDRRLIFVNGRLHEEEVAR